MIPTWLLLAAAGRNHKQCSGAECPEHWMVLFLNIYLIALLHLWIRTEVTCSWNLCRIYKSAGRGLMNASEAPI